MKRYIRVRADWYENDDKSFTPDLTVYEPDRSPQWSGLYDSDGTRLYSYEEGQPVGFVELRER